MRLPRLLLLFFVFAAGCSNSKTGGGNGDSTSVSASTYQPEEIKLTPEEMERVRIELFHSIRENAPYVQYENFTSYEKGFKYVASYTPEYDDPTDESADLFVAEEIDSVKTEATFQIASWSRRPEGGIQNLTLLIVGWTKRDQWIRYEYSEPATEYGASEPYSAGESNAENEGYTAVDPYIERRENPITGWSVTIQVDKPRIYSREDIYLKMRITTLTDTDVAGYSKDELGYLRNEVFARHGHTFKTPKMIKYFEQRDWYKSYVDDATLFLNDIEKKNIEFIKAKETS